MRSDRSRKLREANIHKALGAIRAGMSYRKASQKFRLPTSTLHHRMTTPLQRPGRKTALSKQQEDHIVRMLIKFAERGVPLTREHLKEAISQVIPCLSPAEKIMLPFKSKKPSDGYIRAFIRRHADLIKLGRPLAQEGKRFSAANAESLSTHFATVEKLVLDNNIDAYRIFNLDEVGISPNKDATGKLSCKRIMPCRKNQDYISPSFSYEDRITMMPVISAAGEIGPPLFVIKGKRLVFRTVVREGISYSESPASCLPQGAVLATRTEGGGGIDSSNFLSWAETFVRYTKSLRANGRKVLLIYDAYRSHISLQVLEEFYRNGIIVYALPSHTSDCTGFSRDGTIDIFGLCNIIRVSYENAFTRENAKASFRRSGLWPLNADRLLSESRPRNNNVNSPIVDLEELSKMFEEKRKSLQHSILGNDAKMLTCGYVDTTNGCFMTSDQVFNLIRSKKAEQTRKRNAIEKLRLNREIKAAQRQKTVSDEAARLPRCQDQRRAKMAGLEVSKFLKRVRSMKERRSIAKMRVLKDLVKNDVWLQNVSKKLNLLGPFCLLFDLLCAGFEKEETEAVLKF